MCGTTFEHHLLARRVAPLQSLTPRCLCPALGTGYRTRQTSARKATTRTAGARSDPSSPQAPHGRGLRAAPGTDHAAPLAGPRLALQGQERRESAAPEVSSSQQNHAGDRCAKQAQALESGMHIHARGPAQGPPDNHGGGGQLVLPWPDARPLPESGGGEDAKVPSPMLVPPVLAYAHLVPLRSRGQRLRQCPAPRCTVPPLHRCESIQTTAAHPRLDHRGTVERAMPERSASAHQAPRPSPCASRPRAPREVGLRWPHAPTVRTPARETCPPARNPP